MNFPASRNAFTAGLTADLRNGVGAPLLIALAAVFAACAALRYGVMESDLLHLLCASSDNDPRCVLRTLAPHVFMHERVGLAALAFGSAALLFRSPAVAAMAVLAGGGGLVLYAADYAAVGLLLGLFVRLAARSPVNSR